MVLGKVDFVGLRTNRLAEMVALFRDVLAVPIVRRQGDLVGFKLADGTVLELYGPAEEFHAFFTTGPVVGFRVANFDHVHRALVEAGTPFLSETQRSDGLAWRHFCCPDGTIAEIIGPSAERP